MPADAALVVEDADRLRDLGRSRSLAEEALFHLCNHLAAGGGSLMATGRLAPARWQIALADLASRLRAAPVARLEAPDDALLAAVLVKLFADRQIAVAPDLIRYLLARMERSFAAAEALVAALDRAGSRATDRSPRGSRPSCSTGRRRRARCLNAVPAAEPTSIDLSEGQSSRRHSRPARPGWQSVLRRVGVSAWRCDLCRSARAVWRLSRSAARSRAAPRACCRSKAAARALSSRPAASACRCSRSRAASARSRCWAARAFC